MLRILINSCETHCVSHHRRSRSYPPLAAVSLLSPLSSYSSFLCLWNPIVIFLACKALALSIETKTCFSSEEEQEKGRTSIRRSSQRVL